ncbi:MAG: MBL fold metallo-hydrolase [Christensenellaceae bacterium]|jgi:hydroxyacylglutathione hydrolase
MQIQQFGIINNCFLVKGEAGAILIDTGLYAQREKVFAKIKNEAVTLILLTHGHRDHTDNAAYFREKLSAPIAMHPADLPILKDMQASVLHASALGKQMMKMTDQKTKKRAFEEFAPDVFLEEGMCLAPYGIAGKITALPGHTAGSVGVFLDNGTLIAGDALMHLPFMKTPQIYEEKAELLCSIEKIKKISPTKIYVGHGYKINGKRFSK